jgi:hypothetical protein
MRVLTATLLCAILAGCASQPTSGSGPGSVHTDTSTASVVESASGNSKASGDSHDDVSRALDDEVEKLAHQYHIVERDGVTKYCRKYAPLGSRLSETICLTRNDLYRLAEQELEIRDGWRKPRVCAASCGSADPP